jgi:hypothetical protein
MKVTQLGSTEIVACRAFANCRICSTPIPNFLPGEGTRLLVEQYDPRLRRQLGNFPQAFSYVALVNTAANLSEAYKPAEDRPA